MGKKYFFCIVKTSDLELDPDPDPDPDPLVRGTDPGIRIRTKMSRIPNTGEEYFHSFCLFINKLKVGA
jgi:hypothetical protein